MSEQKLRDPAEQIPDFFEAEIADLKKEKQYRIKLPKTRKKIHISKENSSAEQKIQLRLNVLDELDIENPRILDAYCANGQMWKMAYDQTENYVGLDQKLFYDERKTVVCDNVRYLRSVDVDQFDVFDLDAFGNPFECLYIICNRMNWTRTNKVAIFLTDGTAWNAKRNGQPKGFMHWLGAHYGDKNQYRQRDNYIKTAIIKAAEIADADLGEVHAILKTAGCAMRYIGYVMTKKPESLRPTKKLIDAFQAEIDKKAQNSGAAV